MTPRRTCRRFLRFQVSGIPAEGEVRSAKLRMTASSTGGTVDGPGAHGVTGDWTETGITWANKPATGAEPVSDSGAIAANAKVEYDVTSLVQGQRPARHGAHLDVHGRGGVPLARRRRSRRSSRCSRSRSATRTTTRRRPPRQTSPPRRTGRTSTSAWTAATDNIGVTNYEIYRNGDLLAVTGNVTSYTDTTGLSGATYEYTRQGARQEREPLRREQHRVGDDARHAAPDPARGPDRHGKRRPGRPHLGAGQRQRRRHRLPRLPR